MRQQTCTGTTALDWARRQRSLREALATRTSKARPHDAVHDEPTGHIFQFFGHILAQTAKSATALGAIVVASGQFDFHARDVIRDRTALRLVFWFLIRKAQL